MFITLGTEPGSVDTLVEDKQKGYTILLQGRLFENKLDTEVEDTKPSSILSWLFFSDLYSQDLYSIPATLASL
jgi:hypothetical protein